MQFDSQLSSSTTVSQYLAMERVGDRRGISGFIRLRFQERYVLPFTDNPKKNGFIMMASACLMIESLESFLQGWPRSPNSACAFHQFFNREDRFSQLRAEAQNFYSNVRCGIMHQAETTGGWHIRRDLGVLFDEATKTVDATIFLGEVNGVLSDYCDRLNTVTWESDEWRNLRKKMNTICSNAIRPE